MHDAVEEGREDAHVKPVEIRGEVKVVAFPLGVERTCHVKHLLFFMDEVNSQVDGTLFVVPFADDLSVAVRYPVETEVLDA